MLAGLWFSFELGFRNGYTIGAQQVILQLRQGTAEPVPRRNPQSHQEI